MVDSRCKYGTSSVIPHKRKVKHGGSEALDVCKSKVSEDENVKSKKSPVEATPDNVTSKDAVVKKRRCLM